MKVVIGCPVRSREWIMDRWFFHAQLAADVAEVDVEFAFVVAPDDPTLDIIYEKVPPGRLTVQLSGENTQRYQRGWNAARYRHMVDMRNFLLRAVRPLQPDYFLSLDSDILLHEDALANLIETAETNDFDAVGGKCWMTEHRDACSYIQVVNSHGAMRPDVRHVLLVDIIMAIKLMNPKAYHMPYVYNIDGEDVGWSLNARANGCQLGFDGRVCSKHVLSEFDAHGRRCLDVVDERCGF